MYGHERHKIYKFYSKLDEGENLLKGISSSQKKLVARRAR
jgi:hypothetical protein